MTMAYLSLLAPGSPLRPIAASSLRPVVRAVAFWLFVPPTTPTPTGQAYWPFAGGPHRPIVKPGDPPVRRCPSGSRRLCNAMPHKEAPCPTR